MESLVKLKEQIEKYQCYNEQEEKDKEEILRHLCESAHILTRNNKNAHISPKGIFHLTLLQMYS